MLQIRVIEHRIMPLEIQLLQLLETQLLTGQEQLQTEIRIIEQQEVQEWNLTTIIALEIHQPIEVIHPLITPIKEELPQETIEAQEVRLQQAELTFRAIAQEVLPVETIEVLEAVLEGHHQL
jgi:phage terminase small subunit